MYLFLLQKERGEQIERFQELFFSFCDMLRRDLDLDVCMCGYDITLLSYHNLYLFFLKKKLKIVELKKKKSITLEFSS